MRKWRYGADHNPPIESFRMQAECEAALADLEAVWAGRVFRSPARSAAALALEAELAGALLLIEAPGEREERVRLLAEGDVGEGRTHDRRHWYCVERVGEGVALVFSNGERETAWLARDGHRGWHGRRMASPQAALHASLGEVAAEFEGERRTLVDDLLDASGFPHVDDDDLRAVFALLNKINPDVAERLRAIAATRQWPQKTKRRLEELAASLAVNVPRAEGPRRISIDFDVLGTRYVDPLEP